jgi:hypothetical protein
MKSVLLAMVSLARAISCSKLSFRELMVLSFSAI